MDRIMEYLCRTAAVPSSRRGFLSTAGRFTLGAAGLLAGGTAALGTRPGTAFADNGCCGGTPCSNGCPPGSYPNTYYCCVYDCTTHERECHDCSTPSHQYVCTWSTSTPTICPCIPHE